MMNYIGDVKAGTTIHFKFTTNNSLGAAVAPLTGYEAADVIVYKDGSATQRTSASGITMTSPFDSLVGLHHVSIDLSDNTDAGFWAAGHDYHVVLSADTETVDSQTVIAVVGSFSIENRVVNWAQVVSPTTANNLTQTTAGGNATAAQGADATTAAAAAASAASSSASAASSAVSAATNAAALVTTVGAAGVGLTQVSLTATERDAIATALLDLANCVGTRTLRQLLKIIRAGVAGKSNGFPARPGTVHYRDEADTKNVITADLDGFGNRTNVSVDVT